QGNPFAAYMTHTFCMGSVAMRIKMDVPEINASSLAHFTHPVLRLYRLNAYRIHVPRARVFLSAHRYRKIDRLREIGFELAVAMTDRDKHASIQPPQRECAARDRSALT